MTQTMLTGAQKSKFVMRMPVENKTKPLLAATRQFIRIYAPLLVILQLLSGDPLDSSNEVCFVGEPRISVLNSSNCCKMISLNNDI